MQLEILFEEKLKFLSVVNIGAVPEGMRLNMPFSGEIDGPSISGKVEGTNYVLLRPDGVAVLHAHAVVTTVGGDLVSVEIRGLSTTTVDGRQAVKGSVTYQTGSKEFAWLNSTVGIVDGFTDLRTMEMNANIYKL